MCQGTLLLHIEHGSCMLRSSSCKQHAEDAFAMCRRRSSVTTATSYRLGSIWSHFSTVSVCSRHDIGRHKGADMQRMRATQMTLGEYLMFASGQTFEQLNAS